jgi:hypothetical protein
MNLILLHALMRLFNAKLISPGGFVKLALLIGVAFGLVTCLGWREHTSFLCGTTAVLGMRFEDSALLGTVYLVAYHGFVLLAPILLIAAGILAAHEKWSAVMARKRQAEERN